VLNIYYFFSVSVHWLDPSFCDVNCTVGKPCEYRDEVDFRIIVMTFDRPHSLNNCLTAIAEADTMGKRVSVDIWLDSKDKSSESPDKRAYENALEFSKRYTSGRVCVHKRERNAYIDGQWIDSWRPKKDTKEIGILLEDDVDIAPQSLRWLETVRDRYGNMDDLAGYTLQMEDISRFFAGNKGQLVGPKTDNVFLYGVLGTWGYAPRPESWRRFQDWFHGKDPNLKPYVEGILPTSWYRTFEKQGTQRSMWEMWHIYFTHINKQFSLYCNLHWKLKGMGGVKLANNRQEKGLHFHADKGNSEINWSVLMNVWKDEFGHFPKDVVRYTYDGKQI